MQCTNSTVPSLPRSRLFNRANLHSRTAYSVERNARKCVVARASDPVRLAERLRQAFDGLRSSPGSLFKKIKEQLAPEVQKKESQQDLQTLLAKLESSESSLDEMSKTQEEILRKPGQGAQQVGSNSSSERTVLTKLCWRASCASF